MSSLILYFSISSPSSHYSFLGGIRTLAGLFVDFEQNPLEQSAHFCEYLLDEEGVAAVPGIAFGAENFFRISYYLTAFFFTKKF